MVSYTEPAYIKRFIIIFVMGLYVTGTIAVMDIFTITANHAPVFYGNVYGIVSFLLWPIISICTALIFSSVFCCVSFFVRNSICSLYAWNLSIFRFSFDNQWVAVISFMVFVLAISTLRTQPAFFSVAFIEHRLRQKFFTFCTLFHGFLKEIARLITGKRNKTGEIQKVIMALASLLNIISHPPKGRKKIPCQK